MYYKSVILPTRQSMNQTVETTVNVWHLGDYVPYTQGFFLEFRGPSISFLSLTGSLANINS